MTRYGSRALFRASFCLSLLACGPAMAAGWSGEYTLGHDTNLGNGRQNGDLHESGFALARVQYGRPIPLTARTALLLQVDAQAQGYLDVIGLSNLRAQVLARYLLRPGSGFYVPTLALSGSTAVQAYDSDLRDSHEYRALLYLNQPLTTRLSLRASAAGTWRRDSDDAVFDTGTTQVGLDFDWNPLAALAIYGGYQWRAGDFVSVGLPPQAVLDQASAFASDDVFEGELAFRQDGDARIATLGFNYALSPQVSLDLQAQHADAESDFGIHYRGTLTLASLLWRY